MHLPKRIELWVLLAVIIAGLAWVFLSRDDGDQDATGSVTTAATTEDTQAPLKLHRCTLKRDYNNARLDIDLRVKNDGAEPLAMQAPKVKLLTGKGREVPSFFLPFDPVPQVAPKATQDVQLRYWLESADLQEALKLEIDGKSLPVKSEKPFDLNAMTNGEEKVIQAGAW
ncbi:hypothetical protein AYO49_04695 [Verrucomicrobiaceae bacterium SCGC AG-212-N21]|nr:hypothetical protein AYO49_04695 [Verrucomicrobiaceae bacterium SCGC AG-212-N21]